MQKTQTEKEVVRCPECGSLEVSWDDDLEAVDCFGCGIWFEPNHPNNTACFDTLEAQ